MKSQTDQRNKDLAKIHIAKKQLGLDDDTYREMLRNIVSVDSAKDLDAGGRLKVLNHLHQVGFKSRRKAVTYPNRPNPDQIAGTGKNALINKIEALLAEAGRPWNYAHSMAKHMFKAERLEWCYPDQLRRIVAALMIDARRHSR